MLLAGDIDPEFDLWAKVLLGQWRPMPFMPHALKRLVLQETEKLIARRRIHDPSVKRNHAVAPCQVDRHDLGYGIDMLRFSATRDEPPQVGDRLRLNIGPDALCLSVTTKRGNKAVEVAAGDYRTDPEGAGYRRHLSTTLDGRLPDQRHLVEIRSTTGAGSSACELAQVPLADDVVMLLWAAHSYRKPVSNPTRTIGSASPQPWRGRGP